MPNFCKSDPSHICRWFEMRFLSDFHRWISVCTSWPLKLDFRICSVSLATASNPEWLRIMLAATSRAEWATTQRTSLLHCDLTARLFGGWDGGSLFLMLLHWKATPFEKQISNLYLQSELRFIAPVWTGQFAPYDMIRGLISQITDNTVVGVQSLRWSARLSLIQGCLDDWLLHSVTERQNVTAAEPWYTISLSLFHKLMPTTACHIICRDKTNQCEHINESLVILIILDNWGLIISSHSIETCYFENGDHLYWWWQTERFLHET